MSILIQRPGMLTTVQDLGRHGSRRFGINPGGVMDRSAARLLNALLGNKDGDAMIEMHFPAPRIVFETLAVIAIGGADFDPHVDDKPIPCWSLIQTTPGSTLSFAGKRSGNRSYLAVREGLAIEPWLDSTSTNLAAHIGGFEGRRLEAGDRIRFVEEESYYSGNLGISPWLLPQYSDKPTLRILPGAEFDHLTDNGLETLLNATFEISARSDRMGFRLAGERIKLERREELVSSPVSYGTIQSLPDDQMIVLMADHQTTGGYPRLAHVISQDLPLIAQLGAGDEVRFQLISLPEAEALEIGFTRHLNFLRVGSRLVSA